MTEQPAQVGRKRLSSDGIYNNKDGLQVAIRLKPVSEREKLVWSSVRNCVRSSGNSGIQYFFDKVYGPDADNIKVFEDSVKNIVEYSINGYNGTVFAYGQTASGKTHTMRGTSDSLGVIPLAVKHIVNYIENTPNRTYLIRVSYMEIYNECIRDLLDDSATELKVHESKKDGVAMVSGLKETIVNSEAEIMNCFQEGEERRSVGATNMNEKSSRSHAIFKMVIESQQIETFAPEVNEAIVISHLNFVDLAGSEKVGQIVSNNKNSRFKEGCNINLSLLALSQVISRLSEGKPKQFINYRDSNLTRILKCSLGGNAQTAVICTITPTDYEETLSTLKFAERAKIVKNKPRINEIHSKDSMLKYYEKVINQLQTDLQCEKESKLPQELMQKELEMKDTRITQLEQKLNAFQQKLFVSSHATSFASPAVKKGSSVNRRETWCVPTTFRKTRIPILNLPRPDRSVCTLIAECPDEENISVDIAEDFGTSASLESSKIQHASLRQLEPNLLSATHSQQKQPSRQLVDAQNTIDGCELATSLEQPMNCESRISKLKFDNDALQRTPEQQMEEIIQLKTSQQELENFESCIGKLTLENHELQRASEQQMEEIIKLKATKEELETCKSCIGKVTFENDELRRTSEQQMEEIVKLKASKQELETWKSCIGELTFENDELRRTSKQQMEEIIKLKAAKQELETWKRCIGELTFENDELRTFEQQTEEIIKLKASKQELEKGENRIDQLTLENDTLRRSSEQQMEEIIKLRASKQELENLEGCIIRITHEKEALQKLCDQQMETAVTLEATIQALKAMENQVIELTNETEMLQDTTKQQSVEIIHLKSLKEMLEADASRLSSEINDLKVTSDKQQETIDALKASNQELEDSHSLKLKELQKSYDLKQIKLEENLNHKQEQAVERAVASAIEGAFELLDVERKNHSESRQRERQCERELKILQQKLADVKSSTQKNCSKESLLAAEKSLLEDILPNGNSSERLLQAAAQDEELAKLKKERDSLSEDLLGLRNKQLQIDHHIKELNNELLTKDCELNRLKMYINTEEAPFKTKIKNLEEECKKLMEKNKQLQYDLRRLGTEAHNSTVAEYKRATPLHPTTGSKNIVSAGSGLGMVDSFKVDYLHAENHRLKKEVKKLRSYFQHKMDK